MYFKDCNRGAIWGGDKGGRGNNLPQSTHRLGRLCSQISSSKMFFFFFKEFESALQQTDKAKLEQVRGGSVLDPVFTSRMESDAERNR